MIIEFLLNLIYGAISGLLTPMQLVFQPLGSMLGLVELLSYASIFIPIPTLTICLGIWMAFYTTRFAITIINWLIAKIPTVT